MRRPQTAADFKFVEAVFAHRAHELHRRIAAEEADPISAREREQLQELREAYISRFGEDPDTGLPVARATPQKQIQLPRWLTSALS